MKQSTNRYKYDSNTTRQGQYVPAPGVQRLTPPPRTTARDWTKVDVRAIASGDVFGLFNSVKHLKQLTQRDTSRPGKPALDPTLMTIVCITGVVLGLSTRRLQGYVQGLFKLVGVDPTLAPDHVTISRFYQTINLDVVTKLVQSALTSEHPVLYVAVDGTGIMLSKTGGWVVDKPGSKDKRRGKYDKAHFATNIVTGEIISYEYTPSTGAGSGDASVGPKLVKQLPGSVQVVCADGAYDSKRMFETTHDLLGATLLVPLPANAKYGGGKHRDQLLTQQSRIGRGVWKKRSGYHQRSQVESTNATLDRLVGLSVTNRLPDSKHSQFGIKVQWYNMTRQAGLTAGK